MKDLEIYKARAANDRKCSYCKNTAIYYIEYCATQGFIPSELICEEHVHQGHYDAINNWDGCRALMWAKENPVFGPNLIPYNQFQLLEKAAMFVAVTDTKVSNIPGVNPLDVYNNLLDGIIGKNLEKEMLPTQDELFKKDK